MHIRAERLMIASRVEPMPASDRDWLDAHLENCSTCAARAMAFDAAIRSLRAVPVRIDPAVIEATRLRMQVRARQLRGRRYPSIWLYPAVALSWAWIAACAPRLWRSFAWAAGRMDIPSPLWQMGFVLWWVVPALVVAAALSVRSLQGADATTN